MNCTNCGAELRPGARFCNQCGARQGSAGDPVPVSLAPGDHLPDGSEGEAGGGPTKLKRPPRVPRATVATLDGGDVVERLFAEDHPPPEPSGEQAIAAATDVPPPAAAAEAAAPSPAHGAPGDAAASFDRGATAAQEPATAAADWEEQETAEYETAATPVGDAAPAAALPPLDALAKGQAPSGDQDASPWDPDGSSWPLPLNIIKGGRYRVEAVVAVSDDQQHGENVYRVRDLQGYERCWSCGMEYDATSGANTFCQQCGADMLGRPYLMHERRVQDDEQMSGELLPEPGVPEGERRFVQGRRAYRVVADIPAASPFPRGAHIAVGIGADVGATRPGEQSEDSQAVFALALGLDSRVTSAVLAVVADGLGGHASGQEASELVVRALVGHVGQRLLLPLAKGDTLRDAQAERFTSLLVDGVRAANDALCRRNEEREADMGSTLVAVLVVGDAAYVANAGDSRAYVFEYGDLRRITTDHSLVEQLVAGGMIRPEDRYTHPQRNQIFKSLGDDTSLQPDSFVERLAPGARLLLCSDGLWEMVRDDEIARVLAEQVDPQAACDELVRRANANGGEDNISAVLLEARV